MNRIFLLLLSAVMLSGCFSEGMLKKSANNKLIDSKGFHGSKRRPLYNKKYIDKAKLNVSRGDFEDEEYDDEDQYLENLPPTLKNRYMYEDMIEEDIKAERNRRAKKKSKYLKKMRNTRDGYPDLGRGRDRVREVDSDNHELKSELKEIRTLLDAAREDLVKYRCPLDENGNPSAVVQKAGPKKKIHEQVREEENKNPPKKATKIAPKPSPKKVEPKPPVAPKPKAPEVNGNIPAPRMPSPQSKVEVSDPPQAIVPEPEILEPASSPSAPPARNEPLQNNASAMPDQTSIQSDINSATNNETINISPEQSRQEIEELKTPQLTEIPPAPSDEIEEVTNTSIPALPSFPPN